jgi:uncharacterized integral membrane protein
MTHRILVVLLAAWLLVPAWAHAQYIPPGKEKSILGLFAPYGIDEPADQLGDGAVLAEVRIEASRIVVKVAAGEAAAEMALAKSGHRPEGITGEPFASSAAFDLWLLTAADGPVKAGLGRLADAVKKNDDGGFWDAETVAPPERSEPEPEAAAGPGVSSRTVLLVGGILLLVLLLGLALANVPALLTALAGRGTFFWLGLAVILAAGTGYRVHLGRQSQEVVADGVDTSAPCRTDDDCDDKLPCTVGACEDEQCVFRPDKSLGAQCCQADSDCPAVDARCIEAYCSPAIWECAERPSCADMEGIDTGPSLAVRDTSAAWLLSLFGPDVGSPLPGARTAALLFSVLSLLFFTLFVAVAGGPTAMALGSGAFYALFPPSLLSAVTPGVSAVASAFFFLTLLFAGLARASDDGSRGRLAMALAGFAVAGFSLLTVRPELGLAALVAAALVLRPARHKVPMLVLSGLLALVAVLQLLRLSGVAHPMVGETYPFAGLAGYGTRLGPVLDLLLFQGNVVPFLLVLVALAGLRLGLREFRGLTLFALVSVAAGFFYPALFTTLRPAWVLYGSVLLAPLALLGGMGVCWIARREGPYVKLSLLILAVYFAIYPVQRAETLVELAGEHTVDSPYHAP